MTMYGSYLGWLSGTIQKDTLGNSVKRFIVSLIRFLGDQRSDGWIFTGKRGDNFEYNFGSCFVSIKYLALKIVRANCWVW
jgi:hypothetical protein